MGSGLECAASSTRSLVFSLIDPSVLVAPVRPGGCCAWRGVVTMPVGMGLEQGGPGPAIPARDAGDLIASDDEYSSLAARIHEPSRYGSILRARANPVILRTGGAEDMHHCWCSASRMVHGPPRSGKGGRRAALTCAVRSAPAEHPPGDRQGHHAEEDECVQVGVHYDG